MASPLATLANVRILWVAPAGRSSGRDGFKVVKGQAYLIQAFLKRSSLKSEAEDTLGLPAVQGRPMSWSGYATAFATLTPEQAADWQTIDLSTLTFDESGKLPDSLKADMRAELLVKGEPAIPVRFYDRQGSFGQDGVGSIVRDAIGDSIIVAGAGLA